MFVVAGLVQDRIGPRAVATIGGLLFSLGLLLASQTQSLTDAVPDVGRDGWRGLGFGYPRADYGGLEWFPDHRGLVMASRSDLRRGSGIFGPIAGILIERIGWRATFQVFAGAFFLFTMVAPT
jgi:OFA family oxalate/formate antiporter-like MFS transporter